MIDMKKLILLFLILLPWQLHAGRLRVLAIGNSFSEDAVEQYLYEICAAGGDTLVIGNAYRGGQGLESHWNVVSKGEAAFEYRKVVDGRRTNTRGVTLDSIVRDEDWDVITFQQLSQDAGDYPTYEPFLTQLIAYVKGLASNKKVRFGFQMTWAYGSNSTHGGFAKYGLDQMRMYGCIVEAVMKMKAHHDDISFVIPTGTAIQNARTTSLGSDLTRDGFHLSKDTGRYIAACTWAEMLTGKCCIGVGFRPDGTNPAAAALAQEAAHAAVGMTWRVTGLSGGK